MKKAGRIVGMILGVAAIAAVLYILVTVVFN